MPGDAPIDISAGPGVVRVSFGSSSVRGNLTAAAMHDAVAAMARCDPLFGLVLDVTGVSYVDSAGLAAWIELRNRAHAAGAATILYRPGDEVRRLIEMVGIARLFTVADTPERLEGMLAENPPADP